MTQKVREFLRAIYKVQSGYIDVVYTYPVWLLGYLLSPWRGVKGTIKRKAELQ